METTIFFIVYDTEKIERKKYHHSDHRQTNTMAYYKKMTTIPSRFTVVEDNKELMYRFNKRDRKRKIAYDRDTKFYNSEYPNTETELPVVEVTAEDVYNAWEKHIEFLENQKL